MRIQFTKPATLDGLQLQNELASAGVVADLPNIDEEGNFWLNMDETDVATATPIIGAHVATVAP